MDYSKWDKRFMGLAFEARTWVKGPDLGVGACLVSPDRRGFSLGYSGLPRGMRDEDARIVDPSFKDYHIVHAELNAILNAPGPVVGWTMYVTTHPCAHCASAMIQAGVKRVVSPPAAEGNRWFQHHLAAQRAFEEADIVWYEYEGDR